MTQPRRSRGRARGFSLVEALVALALTGALMAAIAALTGQWLPAWRHGFVSVQRLEALDVAVRRLAADVAAAKPITARGAAAPALFAGGPSAIVFVRQAIGPGAEPRLEWVRIAEQEDGLTRARALRADRRTRRRAGVLRFCRAGARVLSLPLLLRRRRRRLDERLGRARDASRRRAHRRLRRRRGNALAAVDRRRHSRRRAGLLRRTSLYRSLRPPPFRSVTRMAAARDRGFVLVATLWILAALATLASTMAAYMDDAGVAGRLREDELRIEAAERSALELTALRLMSVAPDKAPPRGAFEFELADARIDVAFISESARVDLNGAPKAMLAKLFASLGVDADQAATIAGAVVAWRKAATDDSEDDAYRDAGYAYAPRHAFFQDPLELSLVRGVTPELMRRALPYLTVFNLSGQIDVRVADTLALAALPNIEPDRLSSLISARDGAGFDAEAALRKLGPARAFAAASAGAATRLFVSVALGDGRRGQAEIVIAATPNEARPYRVASWTDQ